MPFRLRVEFACALNFRVHYTWATAMNYELRDLYSRPLLLHELHDV